MQTNETYFYLIQIQGKLAEISVRVNSPSSYLCRLNSLTPIKEYSAYFNEYSEYYFIVETTKYGDPVFHNHGNIPVEYSKSAWEQIAFRLITPNRSEID